MRIPQTTTVNQASVTLLAPQNREVVRFKATIAAGDTPQVRMLAPLYADLLERGTRTRTRKEFAAALERLGAQLTVYSDHFGITIEGCALARTMPAFLELVGEMLREPAFDRKEIQRVHRHYLQSLRDEADDARTRAYAAFTRTLYPKTHPYYRPTAATRQALLESVSRRTYVAFHKSLFSGHMTLGVCGSGKEQKQILDLFAPLANGVATTRIAPVAPPRKKATVYQSAPGKTNVELYIGNTLPLILLDAAFLPFQFGLAVLGKWGGFSGRLMSAVREKHGLTYSIYARTEGVTKTQSGMWYIFTFFTPADLDRGLVATKREIGEIAEKGVTKKEMIRFKELLKNQFILAHDSDAMTLSLYHNALCSGMSAKEIALQYEAMQHLKKNEVSATLAQYLHTDQLVISGAGPVTARAKPRTLRG